MISNDVLKYNAKKIKVSSPFLAAFQNVFHVSDSYSKINNPKTSFAVF